MAISRRQMRKKSLHEGRVGEGTACQPLQGEGEREKERGRERSLEMFYKDAEEEDDHLKMSSGTERGMENNPCYPLQGDRELLATGLHEGGSRGPSHSYMKEGGERTPLLPT